MPIRHTFPRLAALAVACLLALPATAATFTVTDEGDAADATPGDGICATALGNCTLRAAIQEANALAGHDTITFHIAIATPGSPAIIRPQTLGLPLITSRITIDATTQPDSATNTASTGTNAQVMVRLRGDDLGNDAYGLVFLDGSSGSEVIGLGITGFSHTGILIDGEGQAGAVRTIALRGNFIGTDGGDTAQDINGELANDIYGVHVTNFASDIVINGSNLIVGSALGAAVNVSIQARDVEVAENLIGTDRTGTIPIATAIGVLAEYGAHRLRVERNLIGANHTGILIRHGGDQTMLGMQGDANLIRGNRIGIGPNGENLAGSDDGIHITNAGRLTMPYGNTIGGIGVGEGNLITGWGNNGVRISRSNNAGGDTSPRNVILGNSIHDNGELGIELIDITVNPPLGGQPSEPPPLAINEGQAAPVLVSAITDAAVTTLTYQLSSPAGRNHLIEVFSNAACDPSGYGEGQTLIARFDLPDAGGAGPHTEQIPAVPAGTILTLTATGYHADGSSGGTSEFSRCGTTTGTTPTQPTYPAPVHAVPATDLVVLVLTVLGLLGVAYRFRRYL